MSTLQIFGLGYAVFLAAAAIYALLREAYRNNRYRRKIQRLRQREGR